MLFVCSEIVESVFKNDSHSIRCANACKRDGKWIDEVNDLCAWMRWMNVNRNKYKHDWITKRAERKIVRFAIDTILVFPMPVNRLNRVWGGCVCGVCESMSKQQQLLIIWHNMHTNLRSNQFECTLSMLILAHWMYGVHIGTIHLTQNTGLMMNHAVEVYLCMR